jgi:oligopeptide transport system permease protein
MDFALIWKTMPDLLDGAWLTIQITALSLAIGLVATLVSLVIGVTYGAVAGYLGGRVDAVMMRLVDILYAMPFLFFVILLMVFFGRHILLIFVAIGAINWLDMARIVRGQTLSLKQREFVEAARMAGASSADVIRRHIVPNLLGVVAVYVTLTIPQVILFESFLSFLGLGVQEPATSWGSLVKDGADEMSRAPWLLVFPAVFLALTLFCFNFIGDGLRDASTRRTGRPAALKDSSQRLGAVATERRNGQEPPDFRFTKRAI